MEQFFGSIGFNFELNIITLIGLLVSISFLGSKIFQWLGIPQVVGFIVMGVILGTSFLNIVPMELVKELTFISEIALGLIGFDMGSHLRFDDLKKLGRSIFFILIFEAFGTFLLVSAGIYLLTQSLHTALIFGALSSATAPAATVDVLAEYDAKGPLTTSLLAVVGLDDALSLLLFSIIASYTETLLVGSGMPSLMDSIKLPLIEIGGSLLLGVLSGLLLNQILCRMKNLHDTMAISIGFVFLCVGLSNTFGLSLILTTMIMGVTVVNLCADHGRSIRYTIEQAGPVIYVLFFTLVGARFDIRLLPTMGLVGGAYVVLRSLGKFSGAWVGGTIGGASPLVRNNLGLGLLSQAGVAIGLALSCCDRFGPLGPEGVALSAMILSVITATTFVVQVFGPIGVKLAITRAGEIGAGKNTPNGFASEGKPEV
ncbi:MAG: cation:proton antiporter [Anaerolineaceae bacterium]|nr:cation:proton antiporter [Anaerolineaceae bacterium]